MQIHCRCCLNRHSTFENLVDDIGLVLGVERSLILYYLCAFGIGFRRFMNLDSTRYAPRVIRYLDVLWSVRQFASASTKTHQLINLEQIFVTTVLKPMILFRTVSYERCWAWFRDQKLTKLIRKVDGDSSWSTGRSSQHGAHVFLYIYVQTPESQKVKIKTSSSR